MRSRPLEYTRRCSALDWAMRTSIVVVAGALAHVHPGPARAEPDCAPHPIESATTSCPEPGIEVVARAQAAVAAVARPDPDIVMKPGLRFGCELARGWFVEARFEPVAGFRGGNPVQCPGGGDCGVTATWLVPPTGAVKLMPGALLAYNLDIDGDGVAETITTSAKGEMTVWFDRGRKPVTPRQRGTWYGWKRGHVLAQLDGDPALGFTRSTARAYRVTAAGVEEARDVVEALWRDSVAARCPVADVFPAVEPGTPPSPPPRGARASRSCTGPGDDLKVRLSAQVVRAIGDRARAHATLVTDGAPVFDWSCNRRDVAALVTYCEGTAAGACMNERGTWWHEVWVLRGGAMTMVDRSSSGSVLLEWSYTGAAWIAGDADLDGDGEPEPILEHTSCEGGSGRCEHSYRALVRGARLAITSLTAGKGEDTAPRTLRVPGGRTDAVVLKATTASSGGDAPANNPARAWSLVGGHMRELTGPVKRELLERAR